jgi:trk system potassium uptake protein TrkA
VPSQDDTLEAGDELLLVAGAEADTDALQELLVPKG